MDVQFSEKLAAQWRVSTGLDPLPLRSEPFELWTLTPATKALIPCPLPGPSFRFLMLFLCFSYCRTIFQFFYPFRDCFLIYDFLIVPNGSLASSTSCLSFSSLHSSATPSSLHLLLLTLNFPEPSPVACCQCGDYKESLYWLVRIRRKLIVSFLKIAVPSAWHGVVIECQPFTWNRSSNGNITLGGSWHPRCLRSGYQRRRLWPRRHGYFLQNIWFWDIAHEYASVRFDPIPETHWNRRVLWHDFKTTNTYCNYVYTACVYVYVCMYIYMYVCVFCFVYVYSRIVGMKDSWWYIHSVNEIPRTHHRAWQIPLNEGSLQELAWELHLCFPQF